MNDPLNIFNNDPMRPVNGFISDPIHGGCYKLGIHDQVFGMDNTQVGHLNLTGDRINFNPGMGPLGRF